MNLDSPSVSGLQTADATSVSDHLPVVGDFKFAKQTRISGSSRPFRGGKNIGKLRD